MNISNARFANEAGTLIDMEIDLGEGPFPFTYSASDRSKVSKLVRGALEKGQLQIGAHVPKPEQNDTTHPLDEVGNAKDLILEILLEFDALDQAGTITAGENMKKLLEKSRGKKPARRK